MELPRIIWQSDGTDSGKLTDLFHSHLLSSYGVLRSCCPEMADVYAAFVFLRMIADDAHLYDLAFFQRSGEFILQSTTEWQQAIRGLEAIVKSSWWNRAAWVLQETVLPPRATIHFGNN